MLAGLLFANEETPPTAGHADGKLVATLAFVGTTLIEYQARQLVAVGAGQIVVIAAHATPELLGALHRIGRRGVAVDLAPGIADAVPKLHPLARIVMLADGLVAADATVAILASEGDEAILVIAGEDAPPSFERIGAAAAWAGVARVNASRLVEVAALPADYNPQSTLLRVTEAAGAVRVMLPVRAFSEGHGVERDALALDRRGRRIAATAAGVSRHGWFDRYLATPLSRAALPPLLAGGVSGALAAAAAGAIASIAAAALLAGWSRTGLLLALVATLGAGIGATVARIGEDHGVAKVAAVATSAIPLGAMLLLGRWAAAGRGDEVPLVLALVLTALALLAARAMRRCGGWHGSPPAYLLLAFAATLFGWPVAGLTLVTCYAGATLAAAIEDLRGEA